MESFEFLLEESSKMHGHLCPGQVVGVRMGMLGCRLIGLDNPKSREQIKQLLVYVEMDRCSEVEGKSQAGFEKGIALS